MIYLRKGQKLFNNEGMIVCDPTGYYEDGANVVCAMFHSPDEPVCGYEARYIAYGDQVYSITDEKKLLEEIKKIDPNTLMGKTKEDIDIDKMIEEIKIVDNPTPEVIPEEDLVPEKDERVSEIIETNIETDENGEVITTTTTTEEIIPSDTYIDVPLSEPPVDLPVVDIDAPVVSPAVPIIPEEELITPVSEQIVSKLRGKKKII